MKIAVAMSGGVDSSVAAALMVKKYGIENVFGVTAKLFCYAKETKNEKACCSLEAISDAKAVCDKLGIAHYVISEEEDFEKAVIKNFIEAYRQGQTPIPCIPCNSIIKFGTMLKHVRKLGADKLVTGHYARIREVRGARLKGRGSKSQVSNLKPPTFNLLRGRDKKKDQSYFLYGLSQEQLAHVDFPVGGMKKAKVRAIAKKIGLKTAEKRESQGVCFISEGTVADWISDRIPRKPGKIVDTAGNVVGKHEGIVLYTVGQRKRIGGGYDKPMFVVDISAARNEVIIGGEQDLYRKELKVEDIHWINEPSLPIRCSAKIRYNMEDERCLVKFQILNSKSQTNSKLTNSKLTHNSRGAEPVEAKLIAQNYSVVFKRPQRAITPGQSVVFYKGDVCLGGGIIVG